jgi:hypothetical protein
MSESKVLRGFGSSKMFLPFEEQSSEGTSTYQFKARQVKEDVIVVSRVTFVDSTVVSDSVIFACESWSEVHSFLWESTRAINKQFGMPTESHDRAISELAFLYAAYGRDVEFIKKDFRSEIGFNGWNCPAITDKVLLELLSAVFLFKRTNFYNL